MNGSGSNNTSQPGHDILMRSHHTNFTPKHKQMTISGVRRQSLQIYQQNSRAITAIEWRRKIRRSRITNKVVTFSTIQNAFLLHSVNMHSNEKLINSLGWHWEHFFDLLEKILKIAESRILESSRAIL